MAEKGNDIVNELIARHLAGETTPEEQQKLTSWINEDPENGRHYDQLRKAFELAEKHFSSPVRATLDIDVGREWDHFRETVGLGTKTHRLSSSHLWLKIAASLLLVLVASGILFYYTAYRDVVYQTTAKTETISLPDGSIVTLNRNSSLSYARDFNDESRVVELDGEAFFQVESNPDKAFVINTDRTRIQVLGTSFNVNAYDTMQSVEVIVQTGRVSFREKDGTQKVELIAGEKGIYSKENGGLASVPNEDLNFLSWNTRRLVFVERDLRSVIEALEKTYNVNISMTANIPASCLVTVTFENQTLESVLKVLENTLNLKYTISGNNVEIVEAGC